MQKNLRIYVVVFAVMFMALIVALSMLADGWRFWLSLVPVFGLSVAFGSLVAQIEGKDKLLVQGVLTLAEYYESCKNRLPEVSSYAIRKHSASQLIGRVVNLDLLQVPEVRERIDVPTFNGLILSEWRDRLMETPEGRAMVRRAAHESGRLGDFPELA